MKLIVGADGAYNDWACPHIVGGIVTATYITTEGLDLPVDPQLRVRPLPRVICAFPGVQSNELVYWMEDRGADVSLYSGPGYFAQPKQLNDIIQLTEANLSQQRYLIGPIDPNYRNWLVENKIEHALMYPAKSMRSKWRQTLIKLGNSLADVRVFFASWDRTIDDLDKCADNGLVQRYPVTLENDIMYVSEVPEYLKPESSRIKMHVVSYHDHYDFKDGVIADGKEPICQIAGEVYGRVKEHRIQLTGIKHE
jgi:hypothetical protein